MLASPLIFWLALSFAVGEKYLVKTKPSNGKSGVESIEDQNEAKNEMDTKFSRHIRFLQAIRQRKNGKKTWRNVPKTPLTSELNCACGQPGNEIFEISGGREAVPHRYPWIVRLVGGCPDNECAGSLVSPSVILSAYHCAVPFGRNKACDHSDGRRLAELGVHNVWNRADLQVISIIDVLFPPYAGLRSSNYKTHDFALFVLKKPALYNSNVSPICLPIPNADHGGVKAVAAGWGRTNKPSISKWPSNVLKVVDLRVSRKKYKHKKIFGTILYKKQNLYQDPCAGDSGGPLMYYKKRSNQYVLIGTLKGNGYDCRYDNVSTFEGSTNALWNKVSAHMEWIKDTMEKLGDKDCRANHS